MRRFGSYSLWGFWLAWLAIGPVYGAEPGARPEFREVYDLVRGHLTGASDSNMNHAAVQGLISALSPKVSLVTESSGVATEPLIGKTNVLDDGIAYARISRVGDGLAKALREACQQLNRSNTVKGLVLDLRYAGGDDYAAAAAVADLFVKKGRPLLDWGQGMVNAKDKEDALSWPVAALVNRKTTGAAEALAAVVRLGSVGLLLGNTTAGEAMIAQDFPLKNGQKLRIAIAPIRLGDGSTMEGGVKPDIAVQVAPEEELAYYGDAYKTLAQRFAGAGGSQTNLAARAVRRPRLNEAELVRERREGVALDEEPAAARRTGPEKPLINDPTLARAIDLLKGLAMVRQVRS